MSTFIDIKTNRNIPTVANYAALPAAATTTGEYYWVLAAQGTAWLPGSLGGTYYPKGLYFSNGSTWSYMETPVQASLSEVNTGTNEDKFVSPKTLADSDLATKFIWTLDFSDAVTMTMYAPYSMTIDSVGNVVGSPVTTITVNAAPYTLSTPIAVGDSILVTVSVNSVINLYNTGL